MQKQECLFKNPTYHALNRTLYSFNPFRTIVTTSQESMHEDPGKETTNHMKSMTRQSVINSVHWLHGWYILVAFPGLELIGKDYILGNSKPQPHF